MIQTPVSNMKIVVQENSVSLGAVAELFDRLNQEGIRYCHWKSNMRLEQALAGQTDLDVLVDRQHSQLFRQILAEHNLKALVAASGKHYPAIENYLGFDPFSGKLFHLHVHYQLVLGEQFVKNYRLPLEAHFLDTVRMQHGVLTPAPELELIVLSIRALLKYRDRDVVKDILSIRSPGLPADILREIEWLLGRTSLECVQQTLQRLGNILPADVVTEFLNIVSNSPRDGYQLYRLRSRLRQALRIYQRYNRFQASLKYFKEIGRKHRFFGRFWPNQKMTPSSGGQTLALIGADGSGKSTMSQLLLKWLAWKLDVHLYYLGSKQPSNRSKFLYIFFRMTRRGHRVVCSRLGEQNILSQLVGRFRQMVLYSHYLSIGYDRYFRYLASRQKAAAGSIVLYDRYPLEAPLDGPKIHLIEDGQARAIVRIFARLEQNVYLKFRPPDHFLALDVSPTISMQRKPDHNAAMIETKSQLLRRLVRQANQETSKFDLFRIDADQPVEEVESSLKATIWTLI